MSTRSARDAVEPARVVRSGRHGWLDVARRHPTAVAGAAFIGALAAAALLAPWLSTVDPQAIAPGRRLRPPSATAWFGTDMVGRDIYSRTLYGARVSLAIGFAVATAASLIGLGIGGAAGYWKRVDAVAMRVVDGLMAIPPVLLAIALVALTRPSVTVVIVAITISEVPRVVRLVRGVVLTLRRQPFVEGAIALGVRPWAILWSHILPNTIAPLLVQTSYVAASAMLTEATLSFIGAGTPADMPSWGAVMAEGRTVFQVAPGSVLFPGLFLSLTVLAVNLLGDGVRDALDPRSRHL